MKTLLILLYFGFSCFAIGQKSTEKIINGIIVDAQSKTPLEFCTILLLNQSDSSIVTGTTTDTTGSFSLNTTKKDGLLKVSFIGYSDRFISNLPTEIDGKINLGSVTMDINPELLNKVEVVGQKSEMFFKLDKRVFNVGQDLSQSGGSAIDVLENVPSVNVTLEGVVQLRGSSGVQVLINGKPSVLANGSSNALGSITADMIDRIEVITSPSAKYDAEGTVGIINIVLKEEQKKGLNGSVTANIGYPNNHSLGVSANYRSTKFNIFGQIGLGVRRFVSIDTTITKNTSEPNESTFSANGDSEKNENFANLRLGSDFYLNKFNTITLSGHYAYELEKQFANINYLSEIDNALISDFQRNENTTATNPKYQYDLRYQKKFKRHEDQSLDISAVGSYFGKDKKSSFENLLISGTDIGSDQQTRINFKDRNYTFQLDYVHPFSKKWNWELGSKYEINTNTNVSDISNLIDGIWTYDTLVSNNFNYQLSVLANYTTLSYEGEKWGIKGGIRHEQTNAKANQSGQESGNWNYANLFPSIHTSYKLSKYASFQLGYSRRINRPSLFDLSPYFSFRDNFNLFVGNPQLQPEFSNLFELTGIKTWKKINLNASIYHSRTTDVIDEIVTINGNQTITSPQNIGTSNNTGLEVNLKYAPVKWASVLLDGNFSYFSRSGSYEDQVFDFENNKWSTRANFKFKLPADIEMQFSLNYRSRVQNAFTETQDFLYANGGIRKKFKSGKFIVNLSVRDIFNSRINKSFSVRTNGSVYSRRQRGRYVVVGISYNFGKGEAMEFSGHKAF